MNAQARYHVAIIGAGPAGLFAARELAAQNVHVTLFNRDIKPGGLAEYGIYPDKHKMKEGLRSQFRQILAIDQIDYLGNVTIGQKGDLTLADLRDMGYQACLITVGAQGTKWLDLPGETLQGIFHAKDLVYHYNHLPPYSQSHFAIGERVAVIGAGNVMLDISRYLSTLPQVKEIYAVARRGPAEVKFTRAELEYVARLLDRRDLDHELERVAPTMLAIGEHPEEFIAFVDQAVDKATPAPSGARFMLRFLVSPLKIYGDDRGRVNALEVEENTLVIENGEVRAKRLGSRRTIDVDTVVYAIGDQVDAHFGLPVSGSEFYKNPAPRFPVDGNSYEAFDPQANRPIDGVFYAGWARKASSGLVGVARKDGTNGARAILQYLQASTPSPASPLAALNQRLELLQKPVVTQAALQRLEAIEHQRAQEAGLEEFKFDTNAEMLSAIGLMPVP